MPGDEVLNADAVAQITEISDQLKAFVAQRTEDQAQRKEEQAALTDVIKRLKALERQSEATPFPPDPNQLAFLSSGGYGGFFGAPVSTPAQGLAMAGSSLAHPQARPAPTSLPALSPP